MAVAKRNRTYRIDIVCRGCGVTVSAESAKRIYCSKGCAQNFRRAEIKAYLADYHVRHREKKNARSKQFRDEHTEELRDYHAERYARIREQRLLQVRCRTYGLTKEQFLTELEKREGHCDICGREQLPRRDGSLPDLVLDHDHATNRFRGFLCRGCNTALGGFCDDPASLRAAADYIERSRGG